MQDLVIPVSGGAVGVWHRPAAEHEPTVLLVHGLTGTSRWWGAVIDRLPEDMGVIAIDVRGRGASYGAPPPYDLATIADDMSEALDRLGVERATVAGYSMGAWIAAVFERRHPSRVERIVLIDGGLPIPPPSQDADEFIEAMVGPALARLGRVFVSRDDFLDYWRAHPALERHWDDAMGEALEFELEEHDGGFSVRIDTEAVRESARQITVDPEINGIGASVESPVHLIVVERGTADQDGGMIPLHVAERTAAAMPNMTMEYLPGLNHYTLVLGAGAPAVAAAIVSPWLPS